MKNTIDPTNYTAHLRPGKFELEQPATEYFYEQMLNGDGETIYVESPNEIDECWPQAEIFYINADESAAFNLPTGAYYMIREDSQGFVHGSVHPSRASAEQHFQSWIS